jgi:uncharacterized YigZ family protein
MRTLRGAGERETEIKRSRFVCALAPVFDEGAAKEFLQQQRRQHPDARHHCSAWVLGDDGSTQRSSDDGEPGGTAGVPMLEALHRNEVTNAVAVVSRYFGGTLLGAGGLVRAYGGAVSAALEEVGTAPLRAVRLVSTTVDYGLAGKLENALRSAGHRIGEIDHGASVRFDVHVPEDEVAAFETWLSETTAGAAEAERGELLRAEADL